MGMTIATNISALDAYRTLNNTLSQVTSILHRMRDLAVQGANDSNSVSSRAAIKTEADQLGQELDRIGKNTNFNGIALLGGANGDGTAGATSLTFQVGAGSSADNQVTVGLPALGTTLGTLADPTAAAGFVVDTNANATTTIGTIDTAISAVSTARSSLGASENRLQSASDTLAISGQNLTAANSRIADTDMAAEMVNYTQSNILAQAGTAMLAQANQSGQGILKLLQ